MTWRQSISPRTLALFWDSIAIGCSAAVSQAHWHLRSRRQTSSVQGPTEALGGLTSRAEGRWLSSRQDKGWGRGRPRRGGSRVVAQADGSGLSFCHFWFGLKSLSCGTHSLWTTARRQMEKLWAWLHIKLCPHFSSPSTLIPFSPSSPHNQRTPHSRTVFFMAPPPFSIISPSSFSSCNFFFSSFSYFEFHDQQFPPLVISFFGLETCVMRNSTSPVIRPIWRR